MTDITIFPIIEWETQTTPAGYGILNIKILPVVLPAVEPPKTERNRQLHRFGIAAEQCELLAQDMLELAARLREKRKSAN